MGISNEMQTVSVNMEANKIRRHSHPHQSAPTGSKSLYPKPTMGEKDLVSTDPNINGLDAASP
jgi:hypothetical protein